MENFGSQKSNSIKKPMRRRSHTRRVPQDCIINMAEARREIVHALHLHRSSTRKTTTATTTTTTTSKATVTAAAAAPPNILGNSRNFGITKHKVSSSSQCSYYSLTESMPLPEPIWSTTAPTIPAAPSSAMESLEFEWGENQASSYSWWLGFLKNLDCKIVQRSKYPRLEKINAMENSRVFGHQDSSKLGDGPFNVDASDQNSSPDDWLMFPSNDDQGEATNPERN